MADTGRSGGVPVNLDDCINGEARDAAAAIATRLQVEGHINERVAQIVYLAAYPRIAVALRNLRVNLPARSSPTVSSDGGGNG